VAAHWGEGVVGAKAWLGAQLMEVLPTPSTYIKAPLAPWLIHPLPPLLSTPPWLGSLV
jgi:hypothetical protein